MIGIAAQLVGIHPQTLRLYEREELVVPQRTAKDTRLYSENDVELLKEIQEMTQNMGLNLAGVKLILKMKKEFSKAETQFEVTIEAAQKEMSKAQVELEGMRQRMEEEVEKVKKSFQYSVVPYKGSPVVKSNSN